MNIVQSDGNVSNWSVTVAQLKNFLEKTNLQA